MKPPLFLAAILSLWAASLSVGLKSPHHDAKRARIYDEDVEKMMDKKLLEEEMMLKDLDDVEDEEFLPAFDPVEDDIATRALEQAEKNFQMRMAEQMKQGAKTRARAFRKATPLTRVIARDATLFDEAAKILMKDHSFDRQDAMRAIERSTMHRHQRPGGFPPGKGEFDPPPSTCVDQGVICDPSDKYRQYNGTCNNLEHKLWGAAGIGMRRLLPAKYADNIMLPFSGTTAGGLPNVRTVSWSIHPDVDMPDPTVTNMVQQMGQFLDHDITLTPEEEVECCGSEVSEDCFPIHIPTGDPFYTGKTSCLDFARSAAHCFGTNAKREQQNGITAFIDGSNIYGSDEETNQNLRTGQDGLLKVNSKYVKELLPETGGAFFSGDVRVNEMPGLITMHTLFLREHNRLAREIKTQKPNWDDNKIFKETRRLVGAEMQNIVYSEYLPIVMGSDAMTMYRLKLTSGHSEHNRGMDPSIYNSFATAAYRFGHSMILNLVKVYTTAGVEFGSYRLRNNFFNLTQVVANNGAGLEAVLMGLTQQNAQKMDEFVVVDVTNFLFKGTAEFGSDLVARNLQRGRDHGLPGYNQWRQYCGLSRIIDMNFGPPEITSARWDKLKTLYSSPDDIDLFTAGLMETPVTGGLSGPTFNCIKGKQFEVLKYGDRYFFTHCNQPGSFSRDQLDAIRQRTMRDIICQNSDITDLQQNVFKVPSTMNPRFSCSTHVPLDIALFTADGQIDTSCRSSDGHHGEPPRPPPPPGPPPPGPRPSG